MNEWRGAWAVPSQVRAIPESKQGDLRCNMFFYESQAFPNLACFKQIFISLLKIFKRHLFYLETTSPPSTAFYEELNKCQVPIFKNYVIAVSGVHYDIYESAYNIS
jgi:hypothetical protein